ncbi:MAG: TolC family protein [bacterium]|nr:TolC family protein [bacterium]
MVDNLKLLVKRCTGELTLVLIFLFGSFGYSAENLPTSFTLDQAISYALEHNLEFQKQREAVLAAKAQFQQTRSTSLPQLDLTAVGEHLDSIAGNAGRTGDRAYSAFQAAQSLDLFHKQNYLQSIARYNIQVQEMELAQSKLTITYDVTAAFYAILLQEELVKVNESAVVTAQEHLQTAQIRFDKGVNTLADVARAKVDLANRKPALISARNTLIKSRQNFNQLLNLPPNTPLTLIGTLEEPIELPEFENAWNLAQENRPDIKSLLLSVKLYEMNLRYKKSLYFPDITLGAEYSIEHTEYDGVQANDIQDWSVNLKFNLPILDGGYIAGQIREATAKLNQAKLAYAQGVTAAQTEVEQALLELNQQKELILASKEAVELAKLSLSMAQKSFAVGRATSLEVSDAELSLTTAQTNYATAVYNYIVAIAKLKKVMGIDTGKANVQIQSQSSK